MIPPPNCVRNKPLIHQCRRISEGEVRHGRGVLETIGDVLIPVLWEIKSDVIIAIIFGESHTDTYKKDPMKPLLDWWGKENKDKHGKNFQNQQKLFSWFVLSVGGMLAKEALVVLTSFSQIMAAKVEEPILHVCGWINGQITITFARL